ALRLQKTGLGPFFVRITGIIRARIMFTRLLQPLRSFWWLFPLLLFLLLQYRLWFGASGAVANNALERRIQQLQQDNAVQQAENDGLITEVQDLRDGTSVLEEKAREELGLVRDGESFILFVDPPERP